MQRPSPRAVWFPDWLFLPLAGGVVILAGWALVSATLATSLPSPMRTWEVSKPYILAPFDKRGELDQGISRFTRYSLVRVSKGYAVALIVGTPLGLMLGISPVQQSFDPIIQILLRCRPWPGCLSASFCSETGTRRHLHHRAVLMWPTVLARPAGSRNPQEYLNVARVLQLSRSKTLVKVLVPAALPYVPGFRLSLGIAWLVIVAAEMLTGAPGVGGFSGRSTTA
jgi:nitrate/nitrite transport system permease protein